MNEYIFIIISILLAINYFILFKHNTNKGNIIISIIFLIITIISFSTKFNIIISFISLLTTIINIVYSFIYYKELKNENLIFSNKFASFHINRIKNFLIENKNNYILYDDKTPKKNSKIIDEFIIPNQRNLIGIIKIYNLEHRFLSETYYLSYLEFSKSFIKPIYKLSEMKDEEVNIPIKLALNINSLLDENYKNQLMTSVFSFEHFYKTYLYYNVKQNINNNSIRIFILEDVEELINNDINNKECYGIGYCFKKKSQISYFHWVYEWHKKNNIGVYFVDKTNANKIMKILNKANLNQIIESLDFSINFNSDKKLNVLVNLSNDKATETNLSFIEQPEKIYKIKFIKDFGNYLSFFNSLKNNCIDIVSIINKDKSTNSSIYIQNKC